MTRSRDSRPHDRPPADATPSPLRLPGPHARPPVGLPVLNEPPASGPGAGPPPEPPPPPAPPFPEAELRSAIDAAIRLWEPLAARAWAETARRGRGLLALRWHELREAAEAAGRGEDVDPPATWIPVSIVSRGDDFRGLLLQYDPHRQVMLLVGHEDGGEAVFGLECEGDARPTPEACFERRRAQTPARRADEPGDADGPVPPPAGPPSSP